MREGIHQREMTLAKENPSSREIKIRNRPGFLYAHAEVLSPLKGAMAYVLCKLTKN
jgi:hypothetical protein